AISSERSCTLPARGERVGSFYICVRCVHPHPHSGLLPLGPPRSERVDRDGALGSADCRPPLSGALGSAACAVCPRACNCLYRGLLLGDANPRQECTDET